MRRILIDNARRRKALRRGAGAEKVNLDSIDLAAESNDERLLAVHEPLFPSCPASSKPSIRMPFITL